MDQEKCWKGTYFKLVVMKRKFVVTKINVADNLTDRRNERTEKVTYLLSWDNCALMTLWADLKAELGKNLCEIACFNWHKDRDTL